MDYRYAVTPTESSHYSTQELRDTFLVTNLFQPDEVTMTYSHLDRVVIGGIVPVTREITLDDHGTFHSAYFLERREIGIVNIGGEGFIRVEGHDYSLRKMDCLYIGRGVKEVILESVDASNPAHFYFVSTPAHCTYPTKLMNKNEAEAVVLGDVTSSNQRTLRRYIHAHGIQSCQLMLGITELHEGNMWNTMPAHVHDRRMEVYLYFGLDDENAIIHLMGQPSETRHIIVANEQAVLSPSWSIHSGVGTKNYSFIWAMAGENYDFEDMDVVSTSNLR